MDLSLARIEGAVKRIDPVFLDSPQFKDDGLSELFEREVLVKVETVNPIGSFKGRGTSLLAEHLDTERMWVCATAGNFGQGLAYAARARGARVQIFASHAAPKGKVERMRALGARVDIVARPEPAARDYAAAAAGRRILVQDGLDPAISEGAGTIGLELESLGSVDVALVQIGDGALISGVARWLKRREPQPRVVGVCASGAPAMAKSFEAGRAVAVEGAGTIAAALAITDPVPESVARVSALVDEVVLVDDDDLRSAMRLVADRLAVLVEPAGAAGIAALRRYAPLLADKRVAVLLTGASVG